MNNNNEIKFEKDAYELLKSMGGNRIKYGIGLFEDINSGEYSIILYKDNCRSVSKIAEYEVNMICPYRTMLLIVNKMISDFGVSLNNITLLE